jgi:hypothetical protein
MANCIELRISSVQDTHLAGKFSFCSIVVIVIHVFDCVKSFLKVKLENDYFLFWQLTLVQLCKYSKAHAMQSWMDMVLMKPYWFL